jgi:hypothetical protein
MIPEVVQLNPDFIVWCDNKYELNEAAVWPVLASPKGPQAALWMFRHPFLHGGAESEMLESMLQPRYVAQRTQMEAYLAKARAQGLATEDASLTHYATGVQVWDLRHPDSQRLQDTWWDHIMQCGIEDQMSIFVVAQLFPPGAVQPLPGKMVFKAMNARFESYDAFYGIM